jgi:phosphoglycerol transferase
LLFEIVKDELATLSEQKQPFLLSMLTLSTHGPDAYLASDCPDISETESRIPDAIRCTGDNVQSIINEVNRLGIQDETIIFVMNDHLAMTNTLKPQLDKVVRNGAARNDFVAIIGAGDAYRSDKAGTMLDVYPTILEALGYKLADHHANMGVSLLSDKPTLSMTIGLDQLAEAVGGNHKLQNFLWFGMQPAGDVSALNTLPRPVP